MKKERSYGLLSEHEPQYTAIKAIWGFPLGSVYEKQVIITDYFNYEIPAGLIQLGAAGMIKMYIDGLIDGNLHFEFYPGYESGHQIGRMTGLLTVKEFTNINIWPYHDFPQIVGAVNDMPPIPSYIWLRECYSLGMNPMPVLRNKFKRWNWEWKKLKWRQWGNHPAQIPLPVNISIDGCEVVYSIRVRNGPFLVPGGWIRGTRETTLSFTTLVDPPKH